jgi:hypothetical protein
MFGWMMELLGYERQQYTEVSKRDAITYYDVMKFANELDVPHYDKNVVDLHQAGLVSIRLYQMLKYPECAGGDIRHVKNPCVSPGVEIDFKFNSRSIRLLSINLTVIQYTFWERRSPYCLYKRSDEIYYPDWNPRRIGHEMDAELYKNISTYGFYEAIRAIKNKLRVNEPTVYDKHDDPELEYTAVFTPSTLYETKYHWVYTAGTEQVAPKWSYTNDGKR